MAVVDPTKIIEFNKVKVNVINLNPLDADPDELQEGDLWYRGDLHEVRVYLNGSVETLTTA